MKRSEGFTQHLRPRLFAKSKIGAAGLAGRQGSAVRSLGGFTIVELIVAIVGGTALILSAQVAVTNYVHLNQKARNVILVNSYVEAKIEDLRNNGYLTLSNGTTNLSAEVPAGLPSPKSSSMTISDRDAGLKEVAVSVTFNDKGENRTYSYTTLIGELGVGN